MFERIHKQGYESTDKKNIRNQSLSESRKGRDFIRDRVAEQQKEHLGDFSGLSQQVDTRGLRNTLTEPKLQGIVLRSMPLNSGRRVSSLGQELELCWIRVRKVLNGYTPTMADMLKLIEEQFTEYKNGKKVHMGNLPKLYVEFLSYLCKKHPEASLRSLQEESDKFSEQFSNEKASIQINSSRKGDSQIEQDSLPVSMNGEDCHSVSRSPLPNRVSSSQFSEQSHTWHEQRVIIEQQGGTIANLGQKLGSCGVRVRKMLDGYFPTIAATLKLTEQQFIEYETKIKPGIEDLNVELNKYKLSLEKYLNEIKCYKKYVNQASESINVKDLNKYKESLKDHEAFLRSLQKELNKFSEQFSNEKVQIQKILEAAQEIASTYKQVPELAREIADMYWLAPDIVDNPELAQEIAANSQLG